MGKKIIQELSKIGNETTCPLAVIVKDDKILVGLRHYTPDKWKTISVWIQPGGRCYEGEIVEETLRREVEEETGIDDLKILEFITEIPGAKEGDLGLLFLCETNQEPKLMEPHKFSDWKWINFSGEWPENYVDSGTKKAIIDFLSASSKN